MEVSQWYGKIYSLDKSLLAADLEGCDAGGRLSARRP